MADSIEERARKAREIFAGAEIPRTSYNLQGFSYPPSPATLDGIDNPEGYSAGETPGSFMQVGRPTIESQDTFQIGKPSIQTMEVGAPENIQADFTIGSPENIQGKDNFEIGKPTIQSSVSDNSGLSPEVEAGLKSGKFGFQGYQGKNPFLSGSGDSPLPENVSNVQRVGNNKADPLHRLPDGLLGAQDSTLQIPEQVIPVSGQPGASAGKKASGSAAPKKTYANGYDPRLGVSEEVYNNYINAPGERAKVVGAAGAAQEEAARAIADEQHVQNLLKEQRIRDYQAEVAEHNTQVQNQLSKYNTTLDEAKKAQLGGSSFISRNPIAGIAGALASIAGGYAAGKFGGENQGLKSLEGAIQRDLEIQRYNISKKYQDADAQKTVLGQMRSLFKDNELASQAAELQMRDLAADKLNEMAQNASNEKIKYNLQLAAQDYSEQTNQRKMEFEQRLYALNHPVMGTGGVGRAGKKGKSPDEENLGNRIAPWNGSINGSPEEISKVRAQVNGFSNLINQSNTLAEKLGKIGTMDKLGKFVGYNTENVDDVMNQVSLMIPIVSQAFGAGTPGEAEGKRMADAITGQIKLGRDPTKQVREFQNFVRNAEQTLRTTYEPRETKQGYANDPKTGRLEPTSVFTGRTEAPRAELPSSVKRK